MMNNSENAMNLPNEDEDEDILNELMNVVNGPNIPVVESLDESQLGGYAEIEFSNEKVPLCNLIPETQVMQCYKHMGMTSNCNEGVVCGKPVKYDDCSIKGGYASY